MPDQIHMSNNKQQSEGTDIIYYKNISNFDVTRLQSLQGVTEGISILKLEFCNLTAEQMEILASILMENTSLTEVSVNGNPNEVQNFYLLLHKTNILILSLKFCSIDSKGIEQISNELNTPFESNLLHLNLSSNLIGNEGVKYIASFLRINRKLISLNLADNKIYDRGCIELMVPLQKFPLSSEETLIKRRIKFNIERENMANNVRTLKPSKSTTKEKSDKKNISILGPKSDYLNHPFMSDLVDKTVIVRNKLENEAILCKGNDILMNLNLSYNKIGKLGLCSVIQMLDYQASTYSDDKGILRISTEGNNEWNCGQILFKIKELLAVKSRRTSIKNLNLRKRC